MITNRASIKSLVTTSLLLLIFTLSFAQKSYAGFATLHETSIDAIFSQSAFGNTPIDIRFNAVQTIVNSTLLNINSDAKLDAVFSLAIQSAPSNYRGLSLFFVDTISYCGSFGNNIIGCATLGDGPGSFAIVNSSFAAGQFGGALIAHELAHNLGLEHVAGNNTNLMNPIIYTGGGTPALTAMQVAQIFASNSIQLNLIDATRFIEVTPYVIVASIPLPPSFILMITALILLAITRAKLNRRA